jgi:hypothetical protein
MTVIQLHPPPRIRARLPLPTKTQVTGSFTSPSGRTGDFTGHYRLERCLLRSGQLLTAVGVFSGILIDADDHRIGLAARRQASPVLALPTGGPCIALVMGPLDVNLLGFRVTVNRAIIRL